MFKNNSEKLCTLSCQYYKAYLHLRKINDANLKYPMITNIIFSCELVLKSLLSTLGVKFQNIHDLKKLFSNLPQKLQSEITQSIDKSDMAHKDFGQIFIQINKLQESFTRLDEEALVYFHQLNIYLEEIKTNGYFLASLKYNHNAYTAHRYLENSNFYNISFSVVFIDTIAKILKEKYDIKPLGFEYFKVC